MSLISPTTLLVAGSISITLSPAALVCTMRTEDASRASPEVASANVRKKDLVCIAGYFKLRSHVGDPLFLAERPGARAGGCGGPDTVVVPRFRGLQGEGA